MIFDARRWSRGFGAQFKQLENWQFCWFGPFFFSTRKKKKKKMRPQKEEEYQKSIFFFFSL
jgi:hypothetical protein